MHQNQKMVFDDTLFDQYLRFPLPSPTASTDDVSSELSGTRLRDAEQDQHHGRLEQCTETTDRLATEDVPRADVTRGLTDVCLNATGPRIRLRLS